MDISFIRENVKKENYDLSMHAHQERQEEQITINEIEKILLNGDIIEMYSNDPRGKSCLVAGKIADIPLHIVCGKRENKLLIVTVYRPKQPTWKDYKTRTKEVKSRV